MKRILSAGEMKKADMAAIEGGISALVLMERAAISSLDEIKNNGHDISSVFILCGPGNNGGDGIALARLLAEEGNRPSVCMFGNPQKYSEQLKMQLKALEMYDAEFVETYTPGRYSLVVDSLFGIGLKRDIAGRAAELIEMINNDDVPVAALDIASGIDSSSGALMGTAVKADLTVAFECAKIGHILYPGASYTGKLCVRHIGIPLREDCGPEKVLSIEDSDIDLIPERRQDGNKSTFGKVLVIAGSENIFGAAYLSAAAALKRGAGMVKVYTHEKNRTALNVLLPEALIETYANEEPDSDGLKSALEWSDIVIAGPGLGTGSASKKILEYIVKNNDRPAVLDADALNILSEDRELLCGIPFEYIITPHIREMSRLTGRSVSQIKADPAGEALEFSRKHNAVCVLKDAKTVVAYPSGTCYINNSGCSALSTAGSGDVLTGVIAGLKLECRETDLPAEAFAVHIHGRAGEKAAEASSERAVTASELLKYI